MVRKNKWTNSMIVKILLVVIISILLAVISACGMIVERSENTFVETYGDAQEKVFLQIENDLNEYHEGLSKIVEVIDSNWAFRLFFNDKKLDSKMTYRTLYEMDNVINRTATADLQDVSILMLGMNGKYYFRSGEILTWSLEEIKESEITREALENKDRVIYQYVDRGFTSMTSGHPVVMATKALCYKKSKEPYAIVYFMMKEKDMGRFYEYFTSEYSQFYMTDKQNRIVSSDQKKKLGGKMTDVIDLAELNSERTRSTIEREHQNVTVLRKHLPYYGYTIYGVIDSQEALRQFYNIPKLWIICILIAVSVIVITFFIVRQMTKPLSGPVKNMANARNEKYDEHIAVTGSYEIQELTSTYNVMLDDLNHYIDELMNIQKEKRKAEISALQMQINPHYVYNTLASIKWMIYEGEVEKSTRAIDAFISLLRNTIGNMDEYITVEKEIENLKNYVLINNNRYGDKVQVDYFVNYGCEEYLIPKMILQPFVENAFFHAFPYDRRGRITILVRMLDKKLQIQIMDDGVGMTQKRLKELEDRNTKTEHFTGIGVNNVDDRLKLIYGADYGIDLQSEEGKGTTITIWIPIKTEEDFE